MWESVDQAISQIKHSLCETHQYKSKLHPEVLNLEGHSGTKTRHFYNNLLNCNVPLNYLEIGSYMGSSFVSAMYKNLNVHGIAVDNYDIKYCITQEESDKRYGIFLNNVSTFLSSGENILHLKEDFYHLKVDELPKLDVYLFDGDHAEQDQYDAFKVMYPSFADICVVIVDDYNQLSVQSGTEKALAEMPESIPFEVKYKKKITYTSDGSHTPFRVAMREFWNGTCIFVLEKVK